MLILLLPINFLLIFIIVQLKIKGSYLESGLKTVLIFSAILLCATEVLSLFNALVRLNLILFWGCLSGALLLYLVNKKQLVWAIGEHCWLRIRQGYSKLCPWYKVCFYAVLVLVLLVFFQGVFYPPNNWDSMTYHLARVLHWIANRSVKHFPTSTDRELYQPPFAEYVICHFNLLSLNDFFSNSVQFFFYLFSALAVVQLMRSLGLPKWHQAVGLLFCLTIPEVLLEASSTQNDVVVSFFIIASFYFAYKAYIKSDWSDFIFLGISVGLALLTKGTAYVYLPFLLIVLGICVCVKAIQKKRLVLLWKSAVGAGIALLVLSVFFVENYHLNQTLFGATETAHKGHFTEAMTPALLASNIIKNVSLHIPPYPLKLHVEEAVYSLHSWLHIDINNPKVNFGATPFYIFNPINHEDLAGNNVQLLLIFLALCVLLLHFKKIKKKPLPYVLLLLVVVDFIFFCGVLKWQPFHSRLHTTLFLLSMPILLVAAQLRPWFKKLLIGFIPIVLCLAYFTVILNYTRPYIAIPKMTHKNVSIFQDRYQKYFANDDTSFKEYNNVHEQIKDLMNEPIGLMLQGDFEYPLFNTIYTNYQRPYHINVDNYTQVLSYPSVPPLRYIVATHVHTDSIVYKGETFYNQTPINKEIRLFKK